jgi:hypothetical protein
MKIGIKRHLKRAALSLLHMGYYDGEYDDILPGDIYVLDKPDIRNPFIDTIEDKVEVVEIKQDHILFKHLLGGELIGQGSLSRRSFLKKYFREK